MVSVIKSLKEYKSLAENNAKMVVDASAVWCGPCRVMAPEFEALCLQYPNTLFVKFDTDEVQDLAEFLNISSLPSFVFVQNGAVVDTVIGANRAALIARCKTF